MAALFGGAVIELPALAKPAKRAIVDAHRDLGDVRLLPPRRLVNAHAVAMLFEDAIHGQRVKVDVSVEASTEAAP